MTLRTSDTDPLRIYTFTVPEGGKIGITICPGKHASSYSGPTWQRDLDRDLSGIKDWGATGLLTLLTATELEAMAVTALPARAKAAGLTWDYLDILDGGTPTEATLATWQGISPRFHARLDRGEQLLIHCRGGNGRTGTLAAMLLIERGWTPEQALKDIRAVRRGAVENAIQESFVLAYQPGALQR